MDKQISMIIAHKNDELTLDAENPGGGVVVLGIEGRRDGKAQAHAHSPECSSIQPE